MHVTVVFGELHLLKCHHFNMSNYHTIAHQMWTYLRHLPQQIQQLASTDQLKLASINTVGIHTIK